MKKVLVPLLAICAASGLWLQPARSQTPGGQPEDPPRRCGADCRRDVERARAATEHYRDVDNAARDGFIETDPCASSPDGVTGIRYFNPLRWDSQTSVEEPERLLYTPEGLNHAERRLIGLEYGVPVLQDGLPYYGSSPPDPDRTNPPPELFGRSFDGPLPDGGAQQSWRYALVVWVRSDNPSGIFASHNPAQACAVADLRAPEAVLEGCHEVAGIVSLDPERVRRVTGVPEHYEVVGEDRDGAQVLLTAFSCDAITIDGISTPTKFVEITPLIESPFGYRGDFCCSRYLWIIATDNADFADLYRKVTGLGEDQVVYDPDIMHRFEPAAGSTDGGYFVRTPAFGYEMRAVATERPPYGFPISVHIFSETLQRVSHVEFRSDSLQIGPAEAEVKADPASPVAELLGGQSSALVPAFTVSWDYGAAIATVES